MTHHFKNKILLFLAVSVSLATVHARSAPFAPLTVDTLKEDFGAVVTRSSKEASISEMRAVYQQRVIEFQKQANDPRLTPQQKAAKLRPYLIYAKSELKNQTDGQGKMYYFMTKAIDATASHLDSSAVQAASSLVAKTSEMVIGLSYLWE